MSESFVAPHQEQWCWSRLHINDLYATEMERCGERESDCVCAVTSKATDSVEDTSVFSKRD